MTLREVAEILDAAAWRRRQAERACLITGWYAATFAGAAFAGKLDPLKEYLPDEDGDAAEDAVELEPETEEMVWGLLLGPGRPAVH